MTNLGVTVERSMQYGAKSETILRARELRKNMTDAERILWTRLRNKQMNGVRFRRQHPISFYIADFYCHKHRLVIELDGEVHHSADAKRMDDNRTAEMNRLGITVIRFTNDEVISSIQTVLETIKHQINSLSLPSHSGEGSGVGA